MSNSVLSVYREPFGFTPSVRYFAAGTSLQAMRDALDVLPPDFDDGGVICIDGTPVPQALWGLVKPKAIVTAVTFHAPVQGGGGDNKNILATVAAIGLTMVSGGIASGAILGGLTGAAAAGGATILSTALAAGVSYAGSLLLLSLVPPPTQDVASRTDAPGSASAQGNVLGQNASVPRVVGRRKVFPPLAMEPFVRFEGQDEVVSAVYILAGPHDLDDIRIGDTPATSMPGVTIETREGWSGDTPLETVEQFSRTVPVGQELRRQVMGDDGFLLLDDTDDSLPLPMTFVTRTQPDFHEIQCVLPNGLFDTSGTEGIYRLPFRFEMRAVGEATWRKLPEVHYQSHRPNAQRITFRFAFTDALPPVTPTPLADTEGFHRTFNSVPAQTVAPTGGGWTADAAFTTGGAVSNVSLLKYRATFRLHSDDFPPGRYEIRMRRGHPVWRDSLNDTTYQIGGQVYDLFGYYTDAGVRKVIEDLSVVADAVQVLRSVSVWDGNPLPVPGFASIAITARNVQLGAVSVLAGGFVRDWNGSAWSNWTVTSNPAPHLRDVLVGDLNADPIPSAVLDNQSLLDWRAHCTTKGYEVNAIIDDQSISDAARVIAACGYGSLYMSDVWGVIWDRDRSADMPTQVFSNRNSQGFSFSKAFARVPDGFLVNFDNEALGFDTDQILVTSGIANDRLEQVSYQGLITQAENEARAQYDLAQAQYRSTFYSLTCPAEFLVCRRGDLVAVSRDVLEAQQASARILDWTVGTLGNITGLIVDAPLPVSATMSDKAVLITSAAGTVIRPYTSTDGRTLVLSAPVTPDRVVAGHIVSAGPLGSEARRMIVQSIQPRAGYTATVTMVDEAPEIWA